VNILDSEEGLDGHDQLAALLTANIQSLIGETLEFALVELGRGRAVFDGSPSRKAFNPIGSVHGGFAATLLEARLIDAEDPSRSAFTPARRQSSAAT
jgi:acyl-coenzyme A thioesterase PaaI-like protein